MVSKIKLIIEKSTAIDCLVEGCQRQDGQAQRQLYDKLAPKMLGLCCRYILDKPEAEGVMTTGFFKAFERISQFSGNGSFEGWLRRIMINESLLYLRKNKTMQLEVEIDHAIHEPNYDFMDSHLEAKDLLVLISELPIGYRTVFNLYAIEGFSHKEIAKQLEINENTSKSQLSRARTMLKKKLSEQEAMLNNIFLEHGEG